MFPVSLNHVILAAALLLCSSAYAADCRKCNATGALVCPQCDGGGVEFQMARQVACYRCAGSGTVKCHFCRGKGYRGKKTTAPKTLSAKDQDALLKGIESLVTEPPTDYIALAQRIGIGVLAAVACLWLAMRLLGARARAREIARQKAYDRDESWKDNLQ